jgi:hypothetical protein
MVDPIVGKASSKAIDVTAEEGAKSAAKTGQSKFDRVRAELQDEQARQVKIPAEVQKVSLEQQQRMEADLSKRLHKTKEASGEALFRTDMKRAKDGVQQLSNRINALPKTPAFEPFRQRLASIDTQYRNAGQLVNSAAKTDNPKDLMQIQIQLYQLTENLEVMSKVVEQVTSGMKSILQTQL